ncbi:Acyl-CoA synthetase (AMP-forming)/AMP-acid ligase II [Saccharopolyspora antimicrobica]|uniref:Acyl-CoA synthetase (AMP-forming)/AMP-acid ligase II n=1 Tax=Saccharopolyspora antimicrobica TaxID=455193 RepID=A0A1I5FKD6_9PSEU|nr:class I adenylate-forming enzyme family protein [Saccharopolyspora antimicrobica]RKT82202.1 acyl-CoA synthetase (AMP-forming)/AMP-acid ligase II [Saccharopolyspora antimicrobica]SFO24162.1 Acyl-CoA synthetase (AMP-forming)/AMP-acid ligase II [Saccharopolyspora antimicrobica]
MTLLHELLDDAAERWPGRPAITAAGRTLTHLELAAASRRLARLLHERGVRRGQRVVVVLPSSVLHPALIYAASRIGAVISVLHEQTTDRALEHVLDDCEPVLVVSDDVSEPAHARGIAVLSSAELIERLSGGAQEVPEREPLAVDPLFLIYTSGTTSAPKAVVSTHQQVTFAVTAIQSVLRYQDTDVVYCPLPMSFDYGMYQLFLGAASGAHVWLGRPAEVGPSLVTNLVEAGATVLPAVPAVADALGRLLARRAAVVPAIRLVTNTGAAMPAEALARLRAAIPGLRVQLMFGLTECKRATIAEPDDDLRRPGTCGRALPGTEVFTVDGEGRRLEPGEVGEITVRGPNVMAGYWRQPEMSARRFLRRDELFPELRTGDYGWVDEDGHLYFEGRRDDIYKERGFRVSATEVEAAARRVPGVSSAAVLPPEGQRRAVLMVVADTGPDEVLAAMRAEIEEFKIPGRCLVVERIALTRNGKVDRKAMTAMLEADHG